MMRKIFKIWYGVIVTFSVVAIYVIEGFNINKPLRICSLFLVLLFITTLLEWNYRRYKKKEYLIDISSRVKSGYISYNDADELINEAKAYFYLTDDPISNRLIYPMGIITTLGLALICFIILL